MFSAPPLRRLLLQNSFGPRHEPKSRPRASRQSGATNPDRSDLRQTLHATFSGTEKTESLKQSGEIWGDGTPLSIMKRKKIPARLDYRRCFSSSRLDECRVRLLALDRVSRVSGRERSFATPVTFSVEMPVTEAACMRFTTELKHLCKLSSWFI